MYWGCIHGNTKGSEILQVHKRRRGCEVNCNLEIRYPGEYLPVSASRHVPDAQMKGRGFREALQGRGGRIYVDKPY